MKRILLLLALLAAGAFFTLRGLEGASPKVGDVCPNLTGKDADGAAFALADYAGKVVLLDFWGFW